ncbi:WPP domain-interacting protein [Salix suchowensis]|nr:WPP domain-interacting protein [Salix suchowensis]
MDLESESCALESVEDHGLTTTTITSTTPDGALSHGDGDDDDANSKIKANGSFSNGIIHDMGTSGNGHENTMPHDGEVQGDGGIEPVENSVDSLPFMATSPARGSPPTTKGFGLKKWRRIRRDIVKDASAGTDNSKVLKRVFSGAVNPAKPSKLTPAEVMQNSEGSVGSANLFRNAALGDGFVTRGSSLESRFTVASAFSAGTDSENSEDQSSKSSTAASAPRVRHDLLSVSEYAWDKNGVNNLSGKSVGSSAQRVQRGKGWLEISKKPRGERVKIKKENSHSSMESDSRSSNFVFVQGDCSVTSNGKKSGRSMNYDGENSDEAHAVEQQFSGGVHTSYGQENVGEVEDLSEDELAAEASWTDKGEKSENHQPPADQDPFVESILSLQSVQKALENEVQKLGEIGKVSGVVGDSSFANPEIHKSSLPDQFDSESIKESNSLEFKVLSLTQSVQYLESRLEEAKAMLKVKESRVAELEATLNGDRSPKVESASTTGMQQEKSREIENELEGLFKRMIEAEIEHLALSSLRELGVAAGDQITLLKEQEALAGEQVQILNKLGEVENKAASLKKQAGELEKHRGDVLGTEEVLEIQNRVCKVTACFFIQFILLILVLWLFVLQLSPFSGVVVPT